MRFKYFLSDISWLSKTVLLVAILAVIFLAMGETALLESSPDAIAIRVIPNPDHLSAMRWYREKQLTGSPQSLIVDGYEAVRDDRTVFVNAANVHNGSLYTNIYVIAYNLQAEAATTDIFSRILKHWKFNANLTQYGYCRQASIENNDRIFCLLDRDCPIGDKCDSQKARVVRDTRRLADLTELKIMADAYRIQGSYPKLSAGSYLPNKTLSVWPSWKDNLGKELGFSIPQDPVNKIGPCEGYNENTCWNEENKSFAAVFPDLPDNSLAYTYFTDAAGNEAHKCAVLESGLTISGSPLSALCPEVCLDFDRDGFCRPACGACTLDCNDTDPAATAPAGAEVCTGGFDEDCDGLVDCDDPDCGSTPACGGPVCVPNGCGGGCPPGCSPTDDPDCGCTPGNGCCGDGCTYAGGDTDCTQVCVPNGCNGVCPSGCTPAQDPDCGCTAGNGCCGDGCTAATDLDCPAQCVDMDGDGYFAIDPVNCPVGNDCDDTLATGFNIHPGAAEICDGIDNDCDSATADGSGETAPLTDRQAGVCADKHKSCAGVLGWVNNYSVIPGYQTSEENCGDGLDNDCDGKVDGEDTDCMATCEDNSTDESFWFMADLPDDCDQCDNDGDQDGNQSVTSKERYWRAYPSEWADRCDPACAHKGALVVGNAVNIDDFELGTEISCSDGIDNDCDGKTDCDDPDCAGATPCLDTCSDGTTVNTCSVYTGKPWYCLSDGSDVRLEEKSSICGCEESWVPGPNGTFCCDGSCNGMCSNAGCAPDLSTDPDCGCSMTANDCCPAGCTGANDVDCVQYCTFDFTFPCVLQ